MSRQKVPVAGKTKRLVWRISDHAPLGEWIDPSLPPPGPPKDQLPEVSSGRWLRSSFDLLNGVEVNDDPNTVPDELFDELFPHSAPAPLTPPQTPPKTPPKTPRE